MQNVSSVELTRDCDAVQIPVGSPVVLPRGTNVDITQTLGGSYTVHAMGGLYRISPKDADALGIAAITPAPVQAAATGSDGEEPLDEKMVWETLKSCYD